MSTIKVVDVNNEEAKPEEVIEQPIEEAKEEVSNEVVEEPQQETANSVGVETNEIVEEAKEQPKPVKAQDAKPCVKAQDAKPCVKAQDKLVRCPKCNKDMKLQSLRYGHQQKCQGTLEQKPVKPFSKPRATPKPKTQPIQQPIIQEVEPKPTQPVKNQIVQPRNPLADARNEPRVLHDITNHYQLLQQQYIQQKKEKYNNLCQSMFSSKSKKDK